MSKSTGCSQCIPGTFADGERYTSCSSCDGMVINILIFKFKPASIKLCTDKAFAPAVMLEVSKMSLALLFAHSVNLDFIVIRLDLLVASLVDRVTLLIKVV